MPEIKIRTPDDWHLHVRDGAMLKAVLPFTARNFGRPLLMHGRVVDPHVDISDREKVFIERPLIPLTKMFPGLRMILEHLSAKEGVDFVHSAKPQVGGSITPYHLVQTRTDWLGAGLKPYMYVMPVIKTARDRDAVRTAAASGEWFAFLGTDSAAHPVAR